jgi:hypothetical protein
MADKPKRGATLTIHLSEASATALRDATAVVQQAVAKEIGTLK